MTTFVVVAAVVALLAGIGLAIWSKIRSTADWASFQKVQEAAAEQVKEQKQALDKQLEQERQQKREELKHEADEILATEDPSVRQLRALELLAKLRGVR